MKIDRHPIYCSLFLFTIVEGLFLATTSSPASAQSPQFCALISQLDQLSGSDFAQIRGQQRTNKSYYATLVLPQGQDCNLHTDQKGRVVYSCDFNIAGQNLLSSYQTVAMGISSCLPGSDNDIDPQTDDDPVALIRTNATSFYVMIDKDDNTLTITAHSR